MATRNGKLAHLPNDIREQLNLRLLEGETARELAAWLNALPAVQAVLGSQFNGVPISEVNLTHWRQGGYLQWLTERECFDSARALADSDCNLAATGLSAERLLNVLTVRFGELLTQWDLPADESASENDTFEKVARKVRVLQGISRAVLAIHRIQSQSACKKSEPSISSATVRASSPGHVSASFLKQAPIPPSSPVSLERPIVPVSGVRSPESAELFGTGASVEKGKGRAVRNILSGPIAPSNLAQTPFNAGVDLSEALRAV